MDWKWAHRSTSVGLLIVWHQTTLRFSIQALTYKYYPCWMWGNDGRIYVSPSAWSLQILTIKKLGLLLAALFQVKGCLQWALAECMGHSCLLASPVVLCPLCHMCSLGTISEFYAVRRNFPFLKWSFSFFLAETCVMSWKHPLEL